MNYIRNPIERGANNRNRVFKFFTDNPCHTNLAAAHKLDLSVVTVGIHAKAIRDGWRPPTKFCKNVQDFLDHGGANFKCGCEICSGGKK